MSDRAEQTSRTEYAVIVTDGRGVERNLGPSSTLPKVRVTVGEDVLEDVIAVRVVQRRVVVTPQRWESLPMAADLPQWERDMLDRQDAR